MLRQLWKQLILQLKKKLKVDFFSVQFIIHISLTLLLFCAFLVTRHISHSEYDQKMEKLDYNLHELTVFRDSVRIRDSVRYIDLKRLSQKVQENERIIVPLDSRYSNLSKELSQYRISEKKALKIIDKSDNQGLVNIFQGIKE